MLAELNDAGVFNLLNEYYLFSHPKQSSQQTGSNGVLDGVGKTIREISVV